MPGPSVHWGPGRVWTRSGHQSGLQGELFRDLAHRPDVLAMGGEVKAIIMACRHASVETKFNSPHSDCDCLNDCAIEELVRFWFWVCPEAHWDFLVVRISHARVHKTDVFRNPVVTGPPRIFGMRPAKKTGGGNCPSHLRVAYLGAVCPTSQSSPVA